MTSAETLGALVELVPEDAERSLARVGLRHRPGLAGAGRQGRLRHGVDLTPAMLEQAEKRGG